ncbi:MAG: dehydrogenase E1 component subunit alpha/beta [Bacteroidetes bacterium]|nr:dehydrogenase E1 component subunit alpha/beta [Bacteroidota bacterium]MDA0903104.1 dehydrogenase E1 component subunit alpha/beta [Bacteroidota bacterium]MDA1242351.1 dehydrogenase E1 component subunit alpha/beta [Bacteroidota bacterium]
MSEMFPHNPLRFDAQGLSEEAQRQLFGQLLLPRMIEEKMMSQLRQGKISKWFSGMGQEAISVGVAAAMPSDKFIFPMHRNLGIFTTRGIPLSRLFAQFQGKDAGFTKGRDRSFHFGSREHHIVGMISHLGPQLGLADGVALAEKLDNTGGCSFVFTGDGGASEGDFHEAINVAAVWQLPVLIGIENNAWGLSTPSVQQFRCAHFTDKAIGYGIPEEDAIQVDGNDLFDVYHKVRQCVESLVERPRPIILEFKTFRMRGHEEASGTKYYPEGLIETWAQVDPVERLRAHLYSTGVLNESQEEAMRAAIKSQIEEGLRDAASEPVIEASTVEELTDRFAPGTPVGLKEAPSSNRELRFIDAIQEGLRESMRLHDGLVLMGQDIGAYGGVFKVTEGFVEEFGEDRVRNTPLCESAIVGAGLGLSIAGKKAMVEMQFSDFVTCGFNQIVNNLAKIHWRWGQAADVVVRMPTGGGVGAGPYHSQSTEAWFFHVPGLKIAYPSTPADAKGLLRMAIDDPNPVLFFEHKYLYRSLTGPVPEEDYLLEFGVGRIVREGRDATVITYGLGVQWAEQVLDAHPEWSVELIDLRTLLPWDEALVMSSVQKTGKALVLHEDTMTGGIGAEISARIHEQCFEALDAPVARTASLDTAFPFAADLERNFMANARLESDLTHLLRR